MELYSSAHGTDLYWIVGGMLVHHFIFDIILYYKKASCSKKEKQNEALLNPNIIRNRLKIQSVKTNAIAFMKIQEKFGSFDRYIWEFVDFNPILNHFHSLKDLPVSTEISEKMSKSLKKHGFRFVGPTICYALMQAAGLVNDHTTECFRHPNNS